MPGQLHQLGQDSRSLMVVGVPCRRAGAAMPCHASSLCAHV